jgi:hypothetical protein
MGTPDETKARLALTLLMARVVANDVNDASAADDLAVIA